MLSYPNIADNCPSDPPHGYTPFPSSWQPINRESPALVQGQTNEQGFLDYINDYGYSSDAASPLNSLYSTANAWIQKAQEAPGLPKNISTVSSESETYFPDRSVFNFEEPRRRALGDSAKSCIVSNSGFLDILIKSGDSADCQLPYRQPFSCLENLNSQTPNNAKLLLKKCNQQNSRKDGPASKVRRYRTSFSSYQLEELERLFAISHYPDTDQRESLSKIIRLSGSTILVWFQNRRAKFRRLEQRDKLLAADMRQDCSIPVIPETGSASTSNGYPSSPLPLSADHHERFSNWTTAPSQTPENVWPVTNYSCTADVYQDCSIPVILETCNASTSAVYSSSFPISAEHQERFSNWTTAPSQTLENVWPVTRYSCTYEN